MRPAPCAGEPGVAVVVAEAPTQTELSYGIVLHVCYPGRGLGVTKINLRVANFDQQ